MAEAAEDSPAIRKLGRLFRRTESHVWDESYGANGSHKHWRSVETALDGSQTDKLHTKQNNQINEANLFVEDLEFCNLMGSLGLPVSFGTSKEKKSTANKVKKKGKVSYEAACTLIDDGVRTCLSTNEVESVVQLMACADETNPCSPSRTAVGYNEVCPDDIGKMLGENCVSVKQQEEYNCGTLCSAEIVPRNEAENSCAHASIGNPIKSDCPVRENEDVGSVLQLNNEILEQNSVDNDPRIFCTEIRHSEILATRKDQAYEEAPSTSHDDNDVYRGACLSSEDPSPVDSHAPEYDSNFYCEYGDWRVIWDPMYNRYYFYNILTQESTWSPPHGLEDFGLYSSTSIQSLDELGSQYTNIQVQKHDQAGDDRHLDGKGQHCCNEVSDLADIPNEEAMTRSTITTIDEAYPAENIQNDSSMNEALEMNQEVDSTEKKKRVRRSQSYHSCQDLSRDISIDIGKYWTQRYSLFSLFDSGIKMDEEGWFSVTPEPIAKHHTSRVGAGVVIDCFTGVGGNSIQFATKCKHVIAVDIDPQKIDCAQHNATVYGVNDHIDFLVADFIHIAPHLKGDTAFMSPPWGGPDYAKADVYDIKTMLKPCDGYSLFKLARAIASRVVMFLPRNIDQNQLADMCLSVDPPWAVEVEKNFLNGKLKAITAYFEEQVTSDVQHMSDTNPQNADEQDEMLQGDDRGLGVVG